MSRFQFLFQSESVGKNGVKQEYRGDRVVSEVFENRVDMRQSVGERRIMIATLADTGKQCLRTYAWNSSAWNDTTPGTWWKIGQGKKLIHEFTNPDLTLSAMKRIQDEWVGVEGFRRAAYLDGLDRFHMNFAIGVVDAKGYRL